MKIALNCTEMKSLWSFLIVVLAMKTSTLPCAFAEDCTEGCLSCKVKSGCNENNEPKAGEECPANEACTLLNGIPSCVPFAQTSCNCDGERQGCDPIDNTKILFCINGNLYSKSCPDGQQCTGTGQCEATSPAAHTTPVSGGEGSGSRDQDWGSRDQGSGSRHQGSSSRDQDSGSRDQDWGSRDQGSGSRHQDSGSRHQGSSSRDQDSGTTKPATCSEENEYVRYPHETDCKKYYTCRKITLTRYGYVTSSCFGDLLYDKVNKRCELPHKVPDCQQ